MSNANHIARAKKVLAGAHTNLVGGGFAPRFMVRGEGAHLFDADGKEYIDFVLSAGPLIFGHSNPEYIQALKGQLDTLWSLNSTIYQQSALEVEVAEKFVQHVPCAEKVHFNPTASETVQLVLRLARAYTGRPYFIRFEGHYHGWFDNIFGGLVNEEATGRPFPRENKKAPATKGRDAAALEQSFLLPWNEIEILEDVLERYGEEVAMVIMEPILCNAGCCPPRPGYLEKVRELCIRYGVVLCFDEVITGFRVALNSAQGMLGVTPDIATFGKALAGGMPLAAFAGKSDILDLILQGKAVSGGTFGRYPLGLAAALASIKILEQDGGAFYKKIDGIQKRLMDGLREISQRRGIPMFLQGTRGVFITRFVDMGKDVAYSVRDFAGVDMQKERRWAERMAEEGVILMFGGRFYISLAHSEADVDRTLECADRVMRRL
jgi:glutamate-1-semialdehyde 2,1-aminomutase